MKIFRLRPNYLRAIYSDYRRVLQKRFKPYKKYLKEPIFLYSLVILLGLSVIFIQRVFAQGYVQEVGIERTEYSEISPIKASKLKTVQVMQVKVTEPQKPVSAPPEGCVPDNKYASFIYLKESGCDPVAVNPSGCRGLGQACPGDKLPCDNDFACQHKWFTQYSLDRYGSWENAYYFWLENHWW